jgi:hypothetical protein
MKAPAAGFVPVQAEGVDGAVIGMVIGAAFGATGRGTAGAAGAAAGATAGRAGSRPATGTVADWLTRLADADGATWESAKNDNEAPAPASAATVTRAPRRPGFPIMGSELIFISFQRGFTHRGWT